MLDLLTDLLLVAAGMLGAVILVGLEFSPVLKHPTSDIASPAPPAIARNASQEVR